jgi:hypothetical protein
MSQPIEGYITTTVAIAVHQPDCNPVFSEGIITVRLDDEADGPFVVLEQSIDGKSQEVRVSFEEVEALAQAISQLRAQPAIQHELEVDG